MKSPFPYFGGKSRIAAVVWSRFGDVPNYVEPFFGSGAVLLSRPHDYANRVETVNDADGLLSNFWRATQYAPEEVAKHASWPVSECDLHARHAWLVSHREDITARLMGDPDWFDAKAAGWWVWGCCAWIGSGWCSGNGPWRQVDGLFVKTAGQGINRKLPHLGDAGQGINRKLPHLGDAGQCDAWDAHLSAMFQELRDRLRRVRICCGDWSRVCGPAPTVHFSSPCGVFLDPPYSNTERVGGAYAHDNGDVATDARNWAIEHGSDPRYRIALCGYDTEHPMPDDWSVFRWKAAGGYSGQGNGRGRVNASRECIWFSPYCLKDAHDLLTTSA